MVRQGPSSHCMRGVLEDLLGIKNGIAHGWLGRMRIRNSDLAPGGGRRTGPHIQSESADRLRRETSYGSVAVHGPHADLDPRHSITATPLPGTRCGAERKHPRAEPPRRLDAALTLPAARDMACRPFRGRRTRKKPLWDTGNSGAAAGFASIDGVHEGAPRATVPV